MTDRNLSRSQITDNESIWADVRAEEDERPFATARKIAWRLRQRWPGWATGWKFISPSDPTWGHAEELPNVLEYAARVDITYWPGRDAFEIHIHRDEDGETPPIVLLNEMTSPDA